MINAYLTAARPKTLIASISPVSIGAAYAYKEGCFEPILFSSILLFALCIQIGTNFANDYYDFLKGGDTLLRKGPIRPLQLGIISLSRMKQGFFTFFSLAFLFSLFPIYQTKSYLILIPMLSILLGILYTRGPKSLAYIGLAEPFVFFFFGPIASFGTYYAQTHQFSLIPILLGIGTGLISIAILAANNLRDFEEDSLTNKKTPVVRFGKTFGKVEYLLSLTLAYLIPILFLQPLIFLLTFPYSLCYHVLKKNDLSPLLPKTATILWIYTLLCLFS